MDIFATWSAQTVSYVMSGELGELGEPGRADRQTDSHVLATVSPKCHDTLGK